MKRSEKIAMARWLAGLRARDEADYGDESVEMDIGRYVDPERFELEKKKYFLERPQLVALSGDLPEANSFLAIEVAGRPILLTRGRDGKARAFLNACRHRGVQIAEGCGKAARFTCPYHGWTFANDGALAAVPSRESFTEEQLKSRDLIALPIHEELGIIVIHPDPDGSLDFDDFLGPMRDYLEDQDLGQYVCIRDHRSVERINWKHMVEGAVEGYHVATLHRNTFAAEGRSLGHLRLGDHELLLVARQEADRLVNQPDEEWPDEPLFYATSSIFPNTVIGAGGEPILFFQRGEPGTGPGYCNYAIRIFGKRDSSAEQREIEQKAADFFLKVFLEEDIPVQSSSQIAMENGAVANVLYGKREPCLVRMERHFDAVLREEA